MTEGTRRINQNDREKGNLKIMEADTIKHAEMIKIPQNEKTTRSQTALQKSHQTDKYLDYFPRKILKTILKVGDRLNSTNGPGNKTMLKALHSRGDVDRLYVSRKGGRGLANIQDIVHASVK